MKNYRLKKEAFLYFKESLATSIGDLSYWENYHVSESALEEVEDAYITFGHKDKDKSSGWLSGWDQNDGTHFHFTIHYPSVKYHENDKFTDGKLTRDLMHKIQYAINNFYRQFVDDKNE